MNKDIHKKIIQRYQDKIEEGMNEWKSFYSKNIKTAQKCATMLGGEMWEDSELAKREKRGQVTGNFSLLNLFTQKIKGFFADTKYDLTIEARKEVGSQYKEVAQSAIEYHFLSQKYKNIYEKNINYVIDRGFSIIKLDIDYLDNDIDSEKTLVLTVVDNPSECFFDKRATGEFKEDGLFCGRVQNLTKDYIERKYQKLLGKDKEEAQVITFWCKYPEIVEGKGGETRVIDSIYKLIKVDDEIMTCEKHWGYFFPLVYTGRIIRTPDQKKEITVPYVATLKDEQDIYRIIGSKLATEAKNLGSKLLFMTKDLLDPDEASAGSYSNLKDKEGMVVLNSPDKTGMGETIFREVESAPLDQSTVFFFKEMKQLLYEKSGILFQDQRQPQDASGVAVQTRIDYNNLGMNEYAKTFESSINYIASIFQKVLPQVITYEKILPNGITLNSAAKNNPYGTVNSFKEICANYDINIEVTPAYEIKRMKGASELDNLRKYDQAVAAVTTDIALKQINCIDHEIAVRRLEGTLTQDMIDLGSGAIQANEFREKMEIKLRGQEGQQQQETIDPNVQADLQFKMQEAKLRDKRKQEEINYKYDKLKVDKEEKAKDRILKAKE